VRASRVYLDRGVDARSLKQEARLREHSHTLAQRRVAPSGLLNHLLALAVGRVKAAHKFLELALLDE
jgi:hypothetical protein